jgi:hypothetical protein
LHKIDPKHSAEFTPTPLLDTQTCMKILSLWIHTRGAPSRIDGSWPSLMWPQSMGNLCGGGGG